MMEKKFNEGETVRVKTNYSRGYWHGKIGIIDHCTLVGNEWRYIIEFRGEGTMDFDERFLTTRGVKQDVDASIRYAIWNSYTD